jgi:hypothetical protein
MMRTRVHEYQEGRTMSEDKEISAMSAIAKALDGFSEEDADVRERILQWACARYRVKVTIASQKQTERNSNDAKPDSPSDAGFTTFADLYHAANPKSDPDRALVAGYWLGQGAARSEFTGMDTNRQLKNLGHPVGNIAVALRSLIDKRPALVMQTAKSGSSRQARKKYKLTDAGVKAIAEMTQDQQH